MWSESEWIHERHLLYELKAKHPEWSQASLARTLGHSARWVRKWTKRWEGVIAIRPELMISQSRRPRHSPKRVNEAVKQRIGALRSELSERFHRAAGAKTIRHFMAQENQLKVPCESVIERVLRERGYVRPRLKPAHLPLVLPSPNEEWELDFGEIYLGPVDGILEFILAVDRGTSRVVYIEGSPGYRAASAIDASLRLFEANGLPKRLRFDRDPRLCGSWTRDSFPSPFIRLLHALDVEPIVCPPHRPDRKPFVERAIGTLKHEWLSRHHFDTYADAHTQLEPFLHYHNATRPHQGAACQNRTPDEAFPTLPLLSHLPKAVTPDAWLQAEQGRLYRRRVNASGNVQVDQRSYYIGTAHAGRQVLVRLDADHQKFDILLDGKWLKAFDIKGLHPGRMDLYEFVELLKVEARAIEQFRIATWQQTGETA